MIFLPVCLHANGTPMKYCSSVEPVFKSPLKELK